mmetsp:Transcript_79019/g.228423  ORF Transcript_79019/g.228423 Transcript_79019/m.228423 type:complete len:304 (+) Transcript_79019:157-1068(+)
MRESTCASNDKNGSPVPAGNADLASAAHVVALPAVRPCRTTAAAAAAAAAILGVSSWSAVADADSSNVSPNWLPLPVSPPREPPGVRPSNSLGKSSEISLALSEPPRPLLPLCALPSSFACSRALRPLPADSDAEAAASAGAATSALPAVVTARPTPARPRSTDAWRGKPAPSSPLEPPAAASPPPRSPTGASLPTWPTAPGPFSGGSFRFLLPGPDSLIELSCGKSSSMLSSSDSSSVIGCNRLRSASAAAADMGWEPEASAPSRGDDGAEWLPLSSKASFFAAADSPGPVCLVKPPTFGLA